MIKKIQDLTPEEKQRFLEATKREMERNYHTPWSEIEMRIQKKLDDTFDDEKYVKMSPDDQMNGAFLRQEFGKNEPSIVDYLLWAGKFVSHSDDVEIPD